MSILKSICNDNNIDLISINDDLAKTLELTENDVPSSSGFTIRRKNNNPLILYNSSNEWEKNLIISHEIAHCLFGHLSDSFQEDSELCEQEARMFAAAFVANMLWDKYKNSN